MYIYVHTIKKFNKEYFNTYLKLFENHNSTFTVFYVKKITIIFFWNYQRSVWHNLFYYIIIKINEKLKF